VKVTYGLKKITKDIKKSIKQLIEKRLSNEQETTEPTSCLCLAATTGGLLYICNME
jgi:hypothetical protein